MPAQTKWRPLPFDGLQTEPKRLQPRSWVQEAHRTGCNVKPKAATNLNVRAMESMRASIRYHITKLGLTRHLDVRQDKNAIYQITIYHRKREAK